MIRYPDFDFASPPRTGTTWFVQACALTSLGERSRGQVHLLHDDSPTLKITHVRHPCDWLASYFQTIHGGYLDVPCVDEFRFLEFSSFGSFIKSYLRKMPGSIGRMFKAYRATSYIRLEDEPFGLLELLKSCEIEHKATKIKTLAPANRARQHLPIWERHTWAAVLEAEHEFVEEFDYG